MVQRPESVVKELVENSLDAGAKHVFVKISNAGKNLIHILDDGSGMSKEDLELTTKRHATSKVYSKEDLESISSFGFRGEALASISSVASLEIRTKQENQELGWSMSSEPNDEISIEEIDTPKGTQIFVKNLFFNVPARRKFLRSNITELRHISETMMKFALSHPKVHFTYYDSNNMVFDVKPSNLQDRVKELLGNKTSDSMFLIEGGTDEIKINGYLGRPELAKVTRSGQYLFLNSRAIQSKSINHAIVSAFGPLIEKGQHPVFVINLEIDPRNVDINIHPQKHEVKFEEERIVYNLLKNTIAQTLRDNDLTQSLNVQNEIIEQPFETQNLDNSRFIVNRDTGEMIPEVKQNYSERNQRLNFSTDNKNLPFSEERKTAFDEIFSEDDSLFSVKKFLQVHKKYIITQTEKGMLIIDMHNAHERINFENALLRLENHYKNSQKLLFPVDYSFDNSEQLIFDDIKEELVILGFGFDEENNQIIEKPLDVASGMEEEELKEIIEKYKENQEINRTDKRYNIAASYSCRSSIKTGKNLSELEMKKLYDDLMDCENPYVCPHGRPVIMEMSIPDLDKNFGRSYTKD